MPVLRLDSKTVQTAAAPQGRAGHGLLARDDRDRQSGHHVESRRGVMSDFAPQIRSVPRMTWLPRLVQHEGIPTFAIKGEDNATYYRHIESAIAHRPHVSMDDGADVVSHLHSKRKDLLKNVIGGTEKRPPV